VVLARDHGASTSPAPAANPLLGEWTSPHGLPPFEQIKTEDFLPAFAAAVREHDREITAIVANKVVPSFDNTVAALDDSGEALPDPTSSTPRGETSDALQAVEAEVERILAGHADDVFLNQALFARVKAVHDARAKLTLDPEQVTLDRTYRRCPRRCEPRGAAGHLRAINADCRG
jgi:peptidyl-dipeptidase Dcp